MVRVGSIVFGCLLLAALPAAAQNANIFREDAPPPPAAVPAPRVAPRPRYVPQPEPEIAAPAPVPATVQPAVAPVPALPPAGQMWARVRQVAQTEGISVPLSGSPPFDLAGTPPQYRPLLGAWGPGTWQGNPAGDKVIVIIEGVDSDGNVHSVVGKSAGGSLPALWAMSTGLVGPGNRFELKVAWQTFEYQRGTTQFEQVWQIELRPDGTLSGSRDNGASTIVLRRLQ